MITLIHGGMRAGLCLEAANQLAKILREHGKAFKLFDLRKIQFNYCCGDQPCQESGNCIYNDVITNEIIPTVAESDAVVIFTPTYFNAPPAVLKNFMDRCNLLLTIETRKRSKFLTWISGQTESDDESRKDNRKCLVTFAEICEFNIAEGNIMRAAEDIVQTQLCEADLVKLDFFAKEIL